MQTKNSTYEINHFLQLIFRSGIPENHSIIINTPSKLKPNAPCSDNGFASIDLATDFCKNRLERDIWYTPAIYSTNEHKTIRAKKYAVLFPVLFIDIDCGDGKPYPDKDTALPELKRAMSELGFADDSYTVVCSGGGLHMYVHLDSYANQNEWQRLNQALLRALKAHRLDIDLVVGSNAAQLLRPVGTSNCKLENKRPVYIMQETSKTWPSANLSEILHEYILTNNSDKTKNKDKIKSDRNLLAVDSMIIENNCKQIAAMVLDANVPEPLWYSVLGVAAYTNDPKEAAIRWSKNYTNFNEIETISKMNRWKDSTTGPATCSRLRALNPNGCSNCEYSGKVRSPIQIQSNHNYILQNCDFNSLEHTFFIEPSEGFEWTTDIYKLKDRIVSQTNEITSFRHYAIRELNDYKFDETDKEITDQVLQVIIADFTLKTIKNCGLNIGKLPIMTIKEPHKILLFNGKYWQSVSISHIRDIIKSVATKAGLIKTKYQHPRFINGLLHTIIELMPTTPDNDLDRVLLNLDNGTLEFLPNGTTMLYDYNHNDFQRYKLDYKYDVNASCPLFLNFLVEILPDEQTRVILQELIGAIFIQSIKFEKIGILYGWGSNGKSVFLKIIESLLGDSNISNASLNDLTNKEKGPNNRAQLLGKLLNIATELDYKGVQDHAMIKALASREPVVFKRLYQDTFTTDRYASLIFACNGLPRDVEHTLGFFRRFLIVHFNQTILEENQDKELANRIIATELSGILNWAIEGFIRMYTNKAFSKCEMSDNLLDEYKLNTDSVKLFIKEDGYSSHNSLTIELKALYKDYCYYCTEDGYRAVSKKEFGKRLRDLKFLVESGTGNKTMVYIIKNSDYSDVNNL